jgi:EAL domain-containing protein (putative c-di-GMP-specific phosphodiesterase class I)
MHSLQIAFGPPMISVGWASAPAGVDPVAVWKTADECLYAAKRSGGDAVVGTQFSGGEVTASAGPSYTDLLSQVLAGRPLHTVYQPIIDVRDGTTIAYEALARPEGFTPTDSVDGLFEAARRAGRLTELDALCRVAALEGARSLPPDSILCLNVSAGALLRPTADAAELLRLLEKTGRSPQATILEISERERIRDLDHLMAVLATYRRQGVRIAIDDVGEGHTTFELLAASGAEYLKLGRTLTMAASRNGTRASILAAVTFARASGAVVIAEGVENEFACDQIRALGIEYGQGFGLGKPTAPADLEDTVLSMATRTALRPLRPGADRPLD